jgi:hypothetical protein
MKGQIAHLIELTRRPNVIIQVVPDGRGAYLGLNGPITILSFDEGPDVAYFDNQTGGQLVEEAAAVEKCEVRFELIRASALSQEESLELLKAILESL